MIYSPLRTEVRFLKHEQQCNDNNDNFIYIALIKTRLQITSQTDSTSTIYKKHTHMNALILLTLSLPHSVAVQWLYKVSHLYLNTAWVFIHSYSPCRLSLLLQTILHIQGKDSGQHLHDTSIQIWDSLCISLHLIKLTLTLLLLNQPFGLYSV